MRALQQLLGLDLRGTERGRRVGREVGIAHAGREDDDPSLLEVPDGAAADVGLGHLRHVDGGEDPGRLAETLDGVLQGERVDERRQHAHGVRRRAVQAFALAEGAAPDVATAHHDGELEVEVRPHLHDLLSQALHDVSVDGLVRRGGGERLAGHLEDDAPTSLRVGARGAGVSREHGRGPQPPTTTCANRTISALPTKSAMLRFSSLAYACSSSTRSLYHPFMRPSMIFASAASGLPSLRAMVSTVARSATTSSSGTSSRRRFVGRAKAMCTATSWASSSLPPRISTSTALTPRPDWTWR